VGVSPLQPDWLEG